MRDALAAAIVCFLSTGLPIFAQSYSPSAPDIGIQPYHDYHGGDLDRINVDNGNLTLTIPLVSYPQRGSSLKMDFGVVYNGTGRAWTQSCTTANNSTTCIQSWADTMKGIGIMNPFTTTGGPALFDLQDMSSTRKIIPSAPVAGYSNPYYYQEVWYTADGGSHSALQTSTGQISSDGTNIQAGFVWQAGVDPMTSTCTWDCSLSGPLANSTVMATHDGITYFGSGATTNGPVRMDMDGNYISANGSSYTDTVGRVIPFPTVISSPSASQTAQCTGSLPITSINVWTPPGFSEPFTFCYASITTSMPTHTNGPSGSSTYWGSGSQTVLQSIVLPNGQTWTFGYTEQASKCPYGSKGTTNIGDLTHITLPTGGTIDYTYTCVLGFNQTTTAVATRTINANDGNGPQTWSYAYGPSGYPNTLFPYASPGTTIVTDPLVNDTVNTVKPSRTVQKSNGAMTITPVMASQTAIPV